LGEAYRFAFYSLEIKPDPMYEPYNGLEAYRIVQPKFPFSFLLNLFVDFSDFRIENSTHTTKIRYRSFHHFVISVRECMIRALHSQNLSNCPVSFAFLPYTYAFVYGYFGTPPVTTSPFFNFMFLSFRDQIADVCER